MTETDLQKELQTVKEKLADAEAKLRDKEMISYTLLESTLAGYWEWYIQEDWEYLSPTFKSMFGYNDDELPNHPDSWQKIIHPEDLPGVCEVFNKHIETKGEFPYHNEVRYYHKDGSIVWVYCKGEVVEWDDEGKPVRMIGCHVNITPLKKALSLVAEQKEIVESKNQELEQFTYTVSHA